MERAAIRSSLVRVALRGRWASSLAVLVTGALLLPAVGPLLDHHYAERVPGHLHPTGVSVAHAHPYEVDHRHAYRGTYTDASGAPLAEGKVGYLLLREEAAGSSSGSGLTHLLLLALVALSMPPLIALIEARGPTWLRAFTPRTELPPPRPAAA